MTYLLATVEDTKALGAALAGVLRAGDLVVLTGPLGSPAYRTDVLGTLIYRTAFGGSGFSNSDIRMSFAIAVALILFFVMTLISWGMIVVLRKREIQS